MSKYFSFICIVVYLLSFCCDTTYFGVSTSNNILCSLTYAFIHTNILHLFMNLYSLHMFSIVVRKTFRRYDVSFSVDKVFIIAFISSIVSGTLCIQDRVTIGASAIVYFYIGIRFCYTIIRSLKIELASYVVSLLIAFGMSIYFERGNLMIHLLPFLFGIMYCIYLELKYELERCRRIFEGE